MQGGKREGAEEEGRQSVQKCPFRETELGSFCVG
jgi:hypothetical protein